jgi:hypothetical protein
MNLVERIRRDALRCAAATTLDQIEDIVAELVADVIEDDAALARERRLSAFAGVLARRALAIA